MANLSENMRGAVYMMACMAALVLNDALTRLVGGLLSVYQTMFLRGMVTCVLIAAMAAQQGALICRVSRGDLIVIGLRLVGGIGSTICFLTALFNMPFANLSAIAQSMPLAMTLGAALFLREAVGWRRYLAICIGFSGVLLIVRPGAEGFNQASLWAVGAVAFMTLRDLSTRRLSSGIPSLFVTLTTAVGITAAGGVMATTEPWLPVTAGSFGILVLAAAFLFVGQLLNVMCMRHGEIGFVAPFRYTVLVWAILLGVLAFGEIPEALTLVGIAVIVGTGIYTLYREERARRRDAKRLAATPQI